MDSKLIPSGSGSPSAVESALLGVDRASELLRTQTTELFEALDKLAARLTDVLMPSAAEATDPDAEKKRELLEREEKRAADRYAVPLAERIRRVEFGIADQACRVESAADSVRKLIERCQL